MIATVSRRKFGAPRHLAGRVAALLILLGALLATPDWIGDAWGQEKSARVGILYHSPGATIPEWVETFRRNLADHGWIEGKNVVFDFRHLNDSAQLSLAAAELAELKVDVIWADGASFVRAAHAATRTIPIVGIDYTTDPVAEGYVESWGQPGGNVTGVFLDAPEFAGKWFELLKEIIPDLVRVAVLWDPSPGPNHLQAARSVAGSLDIEVQVLEVHKPTDLDKAFSAISRGIQAVIILPSPMLWAESERLARLALKRRLPATSMASEFADAGGIVAYGPDTDWTDDRIAASVNEILRGAKPADIPVERPSKYTLVVNLETAKALGISIPQAILLRADEVIR